MSQNMHRDHIADKSNSDRRNVLMIITGNREGAAGAVEADGGAAPHAALAHVAVSQCQRRSAGRVQCRAAARTQRCRQRY